MKTHKFVNKMVSMYVVQKQKHISMDVMNLRDTVSNICNFLKKDGIIKEYSFGDIKPIDETRLIEFALYYELMKSDKIYYLGLVAVE